MLSLYHIEAKSLCKGCKIPVAVQERKASLDDKGGDQAVHRFAHGHTLAAQRAIVFGTFEGNLPAANREHRQAQQRAARGQNRVVF